MIKTKYPCSRIKPADRLLNSSLIPKPLTFPFLLLNLPLPVLFLLLNLLFPTPTQIDEFHFGLLFQSHQFEVYLV